MVDYDYKASVKSKVKKKNEQAQGTTGLGYNSFTDLMRPKTGLSAAPINRPRRSSPVGGLGTPQSSGGLGIGSRQAPSTGPIKRKKSKPYVHVDLFDYSKNLAAWEKMKDTVPQKEVKKKVKTSALSKLDSYAGI